MGELKTHQKKGINKPEEPVSLDEAAELATTRARSFRDLFRVLYGLRYKLIAEIAEHGADLISVESKSVSSAILDLAAILSIIREFQPTRPPPVPTKGRMWWDETSHVMIVVPPSHLSPGWHWAPADETGHVPPFGMIWVDDDDNWWTAPPDQGGTLVSKAVGYVFRGHWRMQPPPDETGHILPLGPIWIDDDDNWWTAPPDQGGRRI